MEKGFIKNRGSQIVLSVLVSIAFCIGMYVVVMTRLFTETSAFFVGFMQNPTKYVFLFLLVSFVLVISNLFLEIDKKEKVDMLKKQTIISFAMLLTIVLCMISDMYFGRFARPLAITGVFVSVIISKRTAFYSHVAQMLIILLMECFAIGFTPEVIAPSVASLLGGWIMIALVAKDDTRIKTVFSVVKMIPVQVAISVGIYLVFFSFSVDKLLLIALPAAISPIIIGFVYLGVLPIFEALFRIITPYYITELTDINKDLLLRLSIEAPGTFNHSLEVANLAGACALAIGEDVKLARASAYYHDIGKLNDPKVYKENLESDEQNPHDKLTPELSVSLIKRHVSFGIELLKKKRVPQEIINAAAEHHGTLPMKFFYFKATKFTDGFVEIDDYSYDGPLPSSKISAILMIVDGCEAAVRTLTDRNRSKIDALVKSIIEERMELDQFDDCEITFNDLKMIRKTLVDNFAGIYHERIEYPKFNLTKTKKED